MRCPYCNQPIIAGAVSIDGELYRCIYCKKWFRLKDKKLIETIYDKVKVIYE